MGICALVFLWQLSLGENGRNAIYALGMMPAVVFGEVQLPQALDIIPAWLTIFSSMFLHSNWMHLIGNMIYLWIFGDNIEQAMGHGRYLLFYLLCGFVAAMAQALPDISSQIPMIGASGAIAGALGAYLLLYPRANVIVWVPLGIIMLTQRVPAAFVLGFYFLMQLYSSMATDTSQGGIAFGAHIGGFIAGMLLVLVFKKSNVQLFAPARQ